MRTINFCRILTTTSLVAAVLVTMGFRPAGAADPTGDWLVADGVANIRVAECNGAMWGVVAWEKTAGGIDKNNPDVSKRNRPTLGMPILLDMKKKPAKEEWAGQVYNAKDGKLYASTIKLGSPGSARNSGVRARLPLRRGNLDPRCRPDSLKPVQHSHHQSGQGCAEGKHGQDGTITEGGAKDHGQKIATTAAPADPVGDICLLPDIARPTH